MNIGASRSPLFGKAVLAVEVPYWGEPLMPLGDAYRKVVLEREESPQALQTISRNRLSGYLNEMQFIQSWREVKEKAAVIPDGITLTLMRDPARSTKNTDQFMIAVTKSRDPKKPSKRNQIEIMKLTQEELGGPKYQIWSTALAKVKAYLDEQTN